MVRLRAIARREAEVAGDLVQIAAGNGRAKGVCGHAVAAAAGDDPVGRPWFNHVQRAAADGRSFAPRDVAVSSAIAACADCAEIVWSLPPPMNP